MNRVFKSYDKILDYCCFASNKLIDMPWKIISIESRDWSFRSSSSRVAISCAMATPCSFGGWPENSAQATGRALACFHAILLKTCRATWLALL